MKRKKQHDFLRKKAHAKAIKMHFNCGIEDILEKSEKARKKNYLIERKKSKKCKHKKVEV